jgi:[ribosomal protein S18]-alanine N-acetyltransferase
MTVGGVAVRVGTVADLAAVIALERAAVEAPHWSEAEYEAIVELGEETRCAARVWRCLFVADREGRLVGFAVGKVIGAGSGGVAELESVAVDAAARRGGVGRALCGAVVAWCREQGAAAVELEVRAGSMGAIALYRGLGFIAGGRRKNYYNGPVEDALLMRLELEVDK